MAKTLETKRKDSAEKRVLLRILINKGMDEKAALRAVYPIHSNRQRNLREWVRDGLYPPTAAEVAEYSKRLTRQITEILSSQITSVDIRRQAVVSDQIPTDIVRTDPPASKQTSSDMVRPKESQQSQIPPDDVSKLQTISDHVMPTGVDALQSASDIVPPHEADSLLPQSDIVTRDEFWAIINRLNQLESNMEAFLNRQTTSHVGEIPQPPVKQDGNFEGKRVKIGVTLDSALEALVRSEAKKRNLTLSAMLDEVLWHHYGQPQLSFQLDVTETKVDE